jgi:hypothetical protein
MNQSDNEIVLHIENHILNIDDAIESMRQMKRKSKRAVAELRLQIYILVLTKSAIRGLVALLRAGECRSAIILGRCIFEYRLKSEYLLKKQEGSVPPILANSAADSRRFNTPTFA